MIAVGTALAALRPLDDRLHYPLMAEMQPVKNAQRQHRRLLNIGVLGAVKYLHNRLEFKL